MKTVIVSGARTPFGKFGGALRSYNAAELGGIAIDAALTRANWPKRNVDSVIFGNVLQAGQGQLPSRQAAAKAGLPWSVTTETINKVCASGMRSIVLADHLLRLKEADVIVCGGMESMTNAPFYVKKARWGIKLGDQALIDGLLYDGLMCSFTGVHMGTYGNRVAKELGISRQAQDEWAYRSHMRAIKASDEGKLQEEIVPIKVGDRVFDVDESLRRETTVEKLAKLEPVFDRDGTITAGNAPGINDGACALLLMTEEKAKAEGLTPLATIVGHATIAVEPENFPITPGLVIDKLLRETKLTLEEIDLIEINEAFSAVVLASIRIASLEEEKVNVNGGAIAIGHPIGASGARIVLTLAYELKRRGGGYGIAAICSGGGQGDALLLRVDR